MCVHTQINIVVFNVSISNLIKNSCKVIGTDKLILTTCITWYQNILYCMIIAYIDIFDKTIQYMVKEDTRGNYCQHSLIFLDE